MKHYFVVWLLLLSTFAVEASALITKKITLPRPSYSSSPSNLFLETLITEAMLTQSIEAKIGYTPKPMNQKRAVVSLQHHEFIDLSWFAVTPKLEKQLIRIPFPLYKNMHSIRLLITNQKSVVRLSAVKSLEELAQFTGLQKQSWSDYSVLVHNGLQVNGDLNYDGMYQALVENLADYFPRSAMTIKSELKKNYSPALVIEPNLALHYTNTYNFFVSPQASDFAKQLHKGLLILQDTGRYEELFEQFFGDRLHGLNIDNRRVLKLTLPEG